MLGESDGRVRVRTHRACLETLGDCRRPARSGLPDGAPYAGAGSERDGTAGDGAGGRGADDAGAVRVGMTHERVAVERREYSRDHQGRRVRRLHLDASLPGAAESLAPPPAGGARASRERAASGGGARRGMRARRLGAAAVLRHVRGLYPKSSTTATDRPARRCGFTGSSEGVLHTRDGEAIARTLCRDGTGSDRLPDCSVFPSNPSTEQSDQFPG